MQLNPKRIFLDLSCVLSLFCDDNWLCVSKKLKLSGILRVVTATETYQVKNPKWLTTSSSRVAWPRLPVWTPFPFWPGQPCATPERRQHLRRRWQTRGLHLYRNGNQTKSRILRSLWYGLRTREISIQFKNVWKFHALFATRLGFSAESQEPGL